MAKESAALDVLCARVIAEVADYTMVSEAPLRLTIESTIVSIERDLPGPIVECGTWRGGSSFAMLLAQRYRYGRIVKPVWMFDSFEGLPPADARDGPMALAWQADTESPDYLNNCKVQLEDVLDTVARFGFRDDECCIAPGWFSNTLPPLSDMFRRSQIALLRVDCDWYESVLFVLRTLVPCVADEGRVIVDDYYAWDGCARATHDFLSQNSLCYRIRSIDGFGSAWFEKRAARMGPI